jgi:hypothetical protein
MGDVMRILVIALLATIAARSSWAQQLAPAGYSVVATQPAQMPAWREDSLGKLSLRRHIVVGAVAGIITVGVAAAIALAVEDTECLGCAPIIVVPMLIGIGGGAGAIGGAVVYGLRRLSRSDRAQREGAPGT